jgi:hypothetical protein
VELLGVMQGPPLLEKPIVVLFVRPVSHEEWNGDGLTLTTDGWKTGLCSQAAFNAATLLTSTSPSGALASHSSIVRAGLGFGVRIFRAGVFERLAAINRLPASVAVSDEVKHNLILSLHNSTTTSDLNVSIFCQ